MIYLVHFERPYKHARHYLGFTDGTLVDRFARHRSLAKIRRGSALMRVIIENNIAFKVVRIWVDGDRSQERRFKVDGHAGKKCPVCRGDVTYEGAICLIESKP